ncbi:MAG: dihydroorotate dehydrogenase electron transfer subunit [Peptococcaceae bacterium]
MTSYNTVNITRQDEIAPGFYLLSFKPPFSVHQAQPGQFVYLRCDNTYDPLLPRPFSIAIVDGEKNEAAILYQVVGRGTAILAQKKELDCFTVLGPLGRSFTLPPSGRPFQTKGGPKRVEPLESFPPSYLRIAVVAGGVGIAPLFFLLQRLKDLPGLTIEVLIGARSIKQLLLVPEVKSLSPQNKLYLATDDGSYGFHGPVTEILATLFKTDKIDLVYACGPEAMLKTVAGLLTKYRVPGEVSLEKQMGCGVGACLSCVCKTKGDKEDSFRYHRVCKEGPVFPVQEIIWEE